MSKLSILGMLREVTRERHAKGDARKGVALAYSLRLGLAYHFEIESLLAGYKIS